MIKHGGEFRFGGFMAKKCKYLRGECEYSEHFLLKMKKFCGGIVIFGVFDKNLFSM